jgi:predicted MFS family arabinose efflux permease
MAVLVAFILGGSHIHEGTESFTSPEAINYHLPMNVLTVALIGLFLVVQSRAKQPFLDFRYFKQKYFSMALFSNTTAHLSMLTIFTLVPIVIEDGLGYGPIVVTLVLLPHQSLGLFFSPISGWVYDRYNPRWLGPITLFMIASGVALLGVFAAMVPIWGIPLLLLPASVGTAMFIAPYNALVMNSLPDNRSFASGMLETTRQMGHTVGSTIGATILGLSLPAALELMTAEEARSYYQQGFQIAALTVVWIIVAGGVVALFQRVSGVSSAPALEAAVTPGDND